MLKEFIKKMTDWALEKEEEAAKECAISMEQIEKQLKILTEKRDELKQKCDEQLKQLNELIEKVEKIKGIEELKCKAKN